MRCAVRPVPEEETRTGRVRAHRAMKLLRVRAGKEGFVQGEGVSAIRLTGAKSFIGSYGLLQLAMMESGRSSASSVIAVGCALRGSFEPIEPPAPGLLSMTKGCPKRVLQLLRDEPRGDIGGLSGARAR